MSASRKVYTAIAETFKRRQPNPEKTEAYSTWVMLLLGTAAALKADNANFNREKFFEACGYEA